MDELNMNEELREKIRKMIEEGKGNLEMPKPIEHLLTSLCFLMYKKGMDDGFRMAELAIKVSRENVKK